MIIKINKKFNNVYKNDTKKIIDDYLDSSSWKNVCDEYFQMDNSLDNDPETLLNKFKNICYFNFFSVYNTDSISRKFNNDYSYLANCIYKDIKKYIVSDNLKFIDMFYHPLNNCIIYKMDEINYRIIDDTHYLQNKDIEDYYFGIDYIDIKNNEKLINCANILFKYKYIEKDYTLIVCFMKSKNSSENKVIPKIKRLKADSFDEYKQKVLKFLEKKTELKKVCEIKDFSFGS